jgi:DNA-nicking Smr family endonuclease
MPGRERLPVELVDPVATPREAVRAGKAPAPLLGLDGTPAGLDKSTWKKFATGRMRALARLDLHGMTAAAAHHAVNGFVERAYAEQARCVEIITGKGEVLARELPHWLNAPGVRGMILAVTHGPAGNTGAVRVLVRRIRGGGTNVAPRFDEGVKSRGP